MRYLLWLFGTAWGLTAHAQTVEAPHPLLMLTVVATSKERAEAEALIRAANGHETKDALRERIRLAGYVLREKGEYLFAFSPMVVASQARYDLQATLCLLSEQKPLDCPQLRTWLQELDAELRSHTEREQRLEDMRLFTPDMTLDKMLSECNPQIRLVAQVWASMEFDPNRGVPVYELTTFPLDGLKLPSDLLGDIGRSEVQLPPYKAWKERDKELLFLFSDAVGSSWSWQKAMMEDAIEMLDKIHEQARQQMEKLDEAIAREVERRHGFPQGAFAFKDLPPNLQSRMQEIHRNSPVFEWVGEDKPSESALTRVRYEFDIRPTVQVSFQCGERQYLFSKHIASDSYLPTWRLHVRMVGEQR